jgi:hypothetical protein
MKLTRREFLKLASISVIGSAVSAPNFYNAFAAIAKASFPPQPGAGAVKQWGRVCTPSVQLMSRPNPAGERLRWLKLEEVYEIQQEVAGEGWYPHNNTWYAIEDGYAYSSNIQPVNNYLNEPVSAIPLAGFPGKGFYGEVTVPYIDAMPTPAAGGHPVYRLYSSCILYVKKIVPGTDGKIWYDLYDETGKPMFIPGETMRIVTQDELKPLRPEVADKKVVINLKLQRLSAYENNVEVYRTKISAGREYFGENVDGDKLSLTSVGNYALWRKQVSRHMAGGTATEGYDLPGIGWVSYFAANGSAIHSCYWHNDYGRPKSSGCLNCTPKDANWLFRWTAPQVAYEPGFKEEPWPGGTKLIVEG